jgi:hypothetical protein
MVSIQFCGENARRVEVRTENREQSTEIRGEGIKRNKPRATRDWFLEEAAGEGGAP